MFWISYGGQDRGVCVPRRAPVKTGQYLSVADLFFTGLCGSFGLSPRGTKRQQHS